MRKLESSPQRWNRPEQSFTLRARYSRPSLALTTPSFLLNHHLQLCPSSPTFMEMLPSTVSVCVNKVNGILTGVARGPAPGLHEWQCRVCSSIHPAFKPVGCAYYYGLFSTCLTCLTAHTPCQQRRDTRATGWQIAHPYSTTSIPFYPS